MPIYEYLCADCGALNELLIASANEIPICKACGSTSMKKLLSTPSSLSGAARQGFPGPGDTSCCGSSPQQAGCAGPGSCCGKGPF